MPLLLRIDIVPNLGDVLTRQRDAHALDSGDEFRLSDLAFAPFVHETENFCHVTMLIFHPRQHHRRQLFHIVQFARCTCRGLIAFICVKCVASESLRDFRLGRCCLVTMLCHDKIGRLARVLVFSAHQWETLHEFNHG